MNTMVQQARKEAIVLFVKKSKAAKKIKAEAEIKNIDEELDGLIFTGSVLSAIYSKENTPVDN